MGTTKSHRNLTIFCPLLGTVHYWGLLLNKNVWEAGFCPLLGAFPLLGSALLGEYSVFICYPVTEAIEQDIWLKLLKVSTLLQHLKDAFTEINKHGSNGRGQPYALRGKSLISQRFQKEIN